MGDLRRHVGAPARDGQTAEHPLVDETQLAVLGSAQREAHPQVSLVGGISRLHQQLPAHAEVGQQRVAAVEREPEELAPASGVGDHSPLEHSGEVGSAAEVTSHRSRVQDLHRLQAAPHDVALEAAAHHLDLGELRHLASSLT